MEKLWKLFETSVFIYSIAALQMVSAKYEGDHCIVNDSPGVCKMIYECPSAIQDLKQRTQNPVTCGFHKFTPIVCCPVISTPVPGLLDTNSIIKINRRATQNCLKYSQYVFEQQISSNYLLNHCSISVYSIPFATTDSHFTYMASLGFREEADNKWACGGTLISENFVLTSAACAFSRDLGEVKRVRVGYYDKLHVNVTQDFNVAEVITYPAYKPPLRYNDIALLRLDRSASLSNYIIPACLGLDRVEPGLQASTTEWGEDRYHGGDGPVQHINLQVFENEECNQNYSSLSCGGRLKYGIVDDTQICAGRRTEINTFQGVSGEPLQVIHPTIYCMYNIIGITSFGYPSGGSSATAIYTRLSPYIDWIEDIVWP